MLIMVTFPAGLYLCSALGARGDQQAVVVGQVATVSPQGSPRTKVTIF